jgi:adenylate kinase
MNIILFGPPGVGKGTQAQLLASAYNLHHISTGDMLRAAIAAGTELGTIAKQHVESGGLVPDDVIIGLVREVLQREMEHERGFLLDGFPRTVEQARALETLFTELKVEDVRVILLEAPEEELVKRMIKRGQDLGRADDTEETIRHRLSVYRQQTEPVKAYYAASREVQSVDGLGTVDEVTQRLMKCLGHPALV